MMSIKSYQIDILNNKKQQSFNTTILLILNYAEEERTR